MCGEIEDWQEAKTVTVRVTGGNNQQIALDHILDSVEEVRLDEIQVLNFNGGVSGSFYFDVEIQDMKSQWISNERVPGSLILVDALNPHTVFQRPRVLAKGHPVSIQNFVVNARLPSGAAATFDEMAVVLTFVCRKNEDTNQATRVARGQMDYPPSIRDLVANSYNPGN